MALLSQVSQAILACPAILLPGTGMFFLLSNCPDTDSLCYQHPSYLFTDVDRCIMISVHLISTLTVIDMPFPDSLDICQCQRIYFFQKWIFLLYMASVCFNIFLCLFILSNLYHQASDCTENDNSQMFCQEVSSVLLSDRSGNDMLCSILFLSLVFNVLTDYFC